MNEDARELNEPEGACETEADGDRECKQDASPSEALRMADRTPHLVPICYLSQQIAPIGGTIKVRLEDFLVEELPSYEPCGEGEHLYLFVEKRGVSTLSMVRRFARHFDVKESAVGYAGLKDKHAITRQLVSVHLPGRAHEPFASVDDERIAVLWTAQHTNKLRRGHLAGNRFVIRLRDVEATAALPAMKVLNMLARDGVPNRLGEQRFGALGNNHLVGRALVLGDAEGFIKELLYPDGVVFESTAQARELCAKGQWRDAVSLFPRDLRCERQLCAALGRGAAPTRAVSAVPVHERQYLVSSFQSAIFNAVLDERLKAGTLGSLHEGDIAFKHENGSVFSISSDETGSDDVQDRLGRIEISPAGPMWGATMKRASAAVDERERAILDRFGVSPEQFEAYSTRSRNNLPGARRPLRVPLMNHDVDGGMDEHGHYVRLAFELPRGAFATSVMQEVMKTELHAGEMGAKA
jgi:tRNA pseudouridine13 synthase